jgi:hypothetical protein
MMTSRFCTIPALIAFDLCNTRLNIDNSFDLCHDGTRYKFVLRGVMCYGLNHFTSRIVQNDGHTWYHDGVDTEVDTEYEGLVTSLGNLLVCRGKEATAVLYTQEL